MTCYKLVTCEFKWFGLQTRIENFIQKSERRLFTVFHRYVVPFFLHNPVVSHVYNLFKSNFSQVFCWMDRWHGMTMDDIRALEEKTKEELDKQRQLGEVKGMRADSD